MGEVYRAFDPSLQRRVALKILPPELTSHSDRLDRFVREARSASSLNHPNVVTIYEIGEADSVHYIAMELIDGCTLRDAIHSKTADTKNLLRLVLQVAVALGKAHAAGIVHRDLKPDNIMVTADGNAKIVDFGLAKLLEPLRDDTSTAVRSNAIVGTAAYMAPEQMEGRSIDHRCDIYAFGCVLYETLTSKRAFDARFDLTRVPSAFRRVVRRCIEKNPDDRYQSIRDVAADLQETMTPPRPFLRYATIAAVLAAGAVAAILVPWHRPASPQKFDSLAILPFANLSGDRTQDFFVDGVHEAVITDLAQIRALRVISRTSVMQYKTNPKPLPEIARELNVDAIVEGSVVRSGDRVRVTAQLLDARADKHLWAKNYEGSLRDILSLQNEIANAIASEIRVTLAPSERARLAEARPVDPAAYEAFLRGKEIFSRFRYSSNIYKDGLKELKRAVALDPGYAPAWAYLAHGYNMASLFGDMSPAEAGPLARDAIRKALELDPDDADAHMALGAFLLRYDLDWTGAEKEYRRAIELNPGDREAHRTFAWYLSAAGRHEEALTEAQRFYEIDPAHAEITIAWTHLQAGHYDEAIRYYEKGLQFDPAQYWARAQFASACFFKGDRARAVVECDKIPAKSFGIADGTVCAWILANTERPSDARQIVSKLEKDQNADPVFLAVAYAGLGQKDKVLELMERAINVHSSQLWNLGIDMHRHFFASVWNEPRFQAVVRKVNSPALRIR